MKRNLFTSSTVILAMLVLLLHQPAPVQAQSTMVLNAISNAMMLHRASDSGDSRRFTFWLGGPAVFDFRPGNSGSFTVGIGVGPVAVRDNTASFQDSTTGNGIKFGLIGEAFYFPNKNANGLAFNVRVGTGAGTYVAPGLFYVSKPKGGIVGRFGIMAPLGGNSIVPFLPELAIGYRF